MVGKSALETSKHSICTLLKLIIAADSKAADEARDQQTGASMHVAFYVARVCCCSHSWVKVASRASPACLTALDS